jgi:hypothetical protein
MFYRAASNQYINEGQPFEIEGIQYPQNWLNLSTQEEKTAVGLQEVTDANAPEDDRFYWVSSELNGAVRTYTNTPKDLDGLKKQWVSQIGQSAYALLLPSDWRVTKALETGQPVDASWSSWRASVRSTAANAITAINAANDVAALKSAIQVSWPKDPSNTEA